MAGFRLLRRARVDLLEIGAFTADQWGESQAERYLIVLFAGFQTIVDRPERRFVRFRTTFACLSESSRPHYRMPGCVNECHGSLSARTLHYLL